MPLLPSCTNSMPNDDQFMPMAWRARTRERHALVDGAVLVDDEMRRDAGLLGPAGDRLVSAVVGERPPGRLPRRPCGVVEHDGLRSGELPGVLMVVAPAVVGHLRLARRAEGDELDGDRRAGRGGGGRGGGRGRDQAVLSRRAAERLAQSASAAAAARAIRVRRRRSMPRSIRRAARASGASREAPAVRPMYAMPPRRGVGIRPRAG